MSEYIVSMEDITKIYPNGVVAIEGVNLSLRKNEIHAIMGENGAGKSTLMKVLFGAEQPTSGKIFYKGNQMVIENPMKAIKLGIGMVYQYFMLDENLTVAENIIQGMEPTKGLSIDYDKAHKLVKEYSDKYKFNLNPKTLVADLEVGKKQKVEILKSLVRGAQIIILDEPTAVLTPQETEELFDQLIMLKNNGHTILFISHKINEIKQICDRATVLRRGRTISTFDVANVSIAELSRQMVGKDVDLDIKKSPMKKGDIVLKIRDLSYFDQEGLARVKGVNLDIHRGQIFGLVGVEGNGQEELVKMVTGLVNPHHGEILINGKQVSLANPTLDRRKKGLTHIPQDRLRYGSMTDASIYENLIANDYKDKAYNKGLFLDEQKLREMAERLVDEFEIKTDSIHTPVRMLSGGNIQKVVAAREMDHDMDILVANQPTRGIDIGTAALIRNKIIEKRDSGIGVLLISADLAEVMSLSDSLAVFYDGKIVCYFDDASKVTEEELGLYMLGIKEMKNNQMEGLYDRKN